MWHCGDGREKELQIERSRVAGADPGWKGECEGGGRREWKKGRPKNHCLGLLCANLMCAELKCCYLNLHSGKRRMSGRLQQL
jgi:hypothetical protein